jgi:hypothetical protein
MQKKKETLLRALKAIPKHAFQNCVENCKKHSEQCVSSGGSFIVTGAMNSYVKCILFYDEISKRF